jgi:hypothetical protein
MKRKIILLSADEDIFQLYQGSVWRNIDIQENHNDKAEIGSERLNFKWLGIIARIIVFITILLLPLVIWLIAVLLSMAIVRVIKDKKAASNIGDKFILRIEKLKFLRWKQRDYGNQGDWKKRSRLSQKEDVPDFLNRARKYGYERIICLCVNDSNNIERSKDLIHRGFLDSILTYEDDATIYAYLTRDDVQQEYSWIIRLYEKDNISKMVSGNVIYKYDEFEFENPSTAFVCSYTEAGNKIKFSGITLPYNTILDETIVMYFEKEYNSEVNAYISKNVKEIQFKLSKNKLKFLYFPSIQSFAKDSEAIRILLNYKQPDLFMGDTRVGEKSIQQWLTNLDYKQFYEMLSRYLKIPDGPTPALIHCVQTIGYSYNKYQLVYSYSPIWGKSEEEIRKELEHYIEYARDPKDQLYYSLPQKNTPGDTNYDADEEFYWEGAEISEEVKQKIKEIESVTSEEKILETLFYMIKEFKDKRPELCKKLSVQLYNEAGNMHRKISRLFIDKQFRIFLKDYGNIEIEMTPLPKTLYFFMLKHTEGVMLKELYQHKDELLYIYGKIGNRGDVEQMQKSINDITDATSNSINEKCSRIKEAFVSKVDNRIAMPYYINGNRHEPKKIILDRSLVIFEEPF